MEISSFKLPCSSRIPYSSRILCHMVIWKQVLQNYHVHLVTIQVHVSIYEHVHIPYVLVHVQRTRSRLVMDWPCWRSAVLWCCWGAYTACSAPPEYGPCQPPGAGHPWSILYTISCPNTCHCTCSESSWPEWPVPWPAWSPWAPPVSCLHVWTGGLCWRGWGCCFYWWQPALQLQWLCWSRCCSCTYPCTWHHGQGWPPWPCGAAIQWWPIIFNIIIKARSSTLTWRGECVGASAPHPIPPSSHPCIHTFHLSTH